jgi:hypothetical protein
VSPLPVLPSGAQPPVIMIPHSRYNHQIVSGRDDSFLNPWQWDIPHPPPLPPRTTEVRPNSIQQSLPPQTQVRPRSAGDEYESIAFPQPQISRSTSQLPHRHSQFDIQRGRHDTSHLQWQPNTSVTSFASYNANDIWYEVCRFYSRDKGAMDLLYN